MARIDGGPSKDRLFGTPLRDQIFGFQGDDVLYGRGESDFLNGGVGDDRLIGGTGNDELFGDSGRDTLSGGAGRDFLDGGTGPDTMAGGSGDDTYYVDDAGDRVIETGIGATRAETDFGGGRDTVVSDVAVYTLPKFVEVLYLRSGAVSGTGNSLDNEIYGNETDNVLAGLAGMDVLRGAGGRDTLFGGAGEDILDGGAGIDSMAGGSGNDTYYVDEIQDVVVEVISAEPLETDLKHKVKLDVGFKLDLSGHDLVYSSAFGFSLPEGVEDLTLIGDASWGFGNDLDNVITGNELDNLLEGGGGNDRLHGRLGGDLMKGGMGDDNYVVEDADDQVLEFTGEGTDTVVSFRLSYTLSPNVERLLLEGFAASGTGNELDNFVFGNQLANYLDGAAGRDTLVGESGDDTLTGGANADLFVFSLPAKNGSVVPIEDSPGIDTITDFVPGEDKIGIVSTGGTASGLNPDMFVAGLSPVATKHTPTMLYNTGTGALSVDLDGSGAGAPVQFAVLVGSPALTASDIILLA